MKFDIIDIAQAIGVDSSRLFSSEIKDLMIDSRLVVNPATTLFVALTTPNNDGHAYIRRLIDLGVRNFVVSREMAPVEGVNFLRVDNTLEALQRIGRFCRRNCGGLFIGVTGSRGKTVVKEWIYQALEGEKLEACFNGECHDADARIRTLKIGRSPRSYNSQIGVPLSMWQLDSYNDINIIEAGVSEEGEMARLATIVAPDLGIITTITDEHADGFSSRLKKIEEKLDLFESTQAIIYNADDPDVENAVRKRFADKRLIGVHASEKGNVVDNLAYVEATLSLLGWPREKAKRLMEKVYPVKTRLNVIEGVNDSKLIFDRFTADIQSLRGALDFMLRSAVGDQRRTLIIAEDIVKESEDAFQSVVADYKIDRVLTVAPGDDLTTKFTPDDFYREIILLKGSRAVDLEPLYSILEAKQHETLLEVNLDAIISNFNFFRAKVKPTTGVICMLKAHGYGAGSTELARVLQAQGAAYIAVAVVDEGIELRNAGITMPIMVLNPRAQNTKMMFDYRLEPEIYSFDMLESVISSAQRYGIKEFPIHIKLETGMRRLGFVEEEMERLGLRLSETDCVKASTIFSHLACADDPAEDGYTRQQFKIFAECCDRLDTFLPEKPKRHILNSTGILRFPEMQYDFVRLGIGLYGIPTIFDGTEDALRNVSTLTSPIISLKHWKAGDTVGYNRRGRLDHDALIATVPVGYADGIDRHLGYGNLKVMVCGHLCPTVGSICMDICMIDVTGTDCKIGDRVEFFGDNISPGVLADTLTTIPYEILTSISPRVKRVYFRE